jgi:carbon-monoxide dehydrogenase small subunit
MGEAVSFVLNGAKVRWTGPDGSRLLDVLRNEFGLTGTKCGCKEGECGACSVLIDHKLVNSCMVAMGSLEGAEITTIEGFSQTERFRALDRGFAAVSAVQCGFCIPGMVLAAEALLHRNGDPSEAEIREAISGNLCRCTGYNAIVKAIQIAAEEGKGLW